MALLETSYVIRICELSCSRFTPCARASSNRPVGFDVQTAPVRLFFSRISAVSPWIYNSISPEPATRKASCAAFILES